MLADRSSPLAAAGFSLTAPRVDLNGPPFRDAGTASARPWGCPARVRYAVSRPA